jgi:hypothetical protein
LDSDSISHKELKIGNRTDTIYPDPRCVACLKNLADDIIHMVGPGAMRHRETKSVRR